DAAAQPSQGRRPRRAATVSAEGGGRGRGLQRHPLSGGRVHLAHRVSRAGRNPRAGAAGPRGVPFGPAGPRGHAGRGGSDRELPQADGRPGDRPLPRRGHQRHPRKPQRRRVRGPGAARGGDRPGGDHRDGRGAPGLRGHPRAGAVRKEEVAAGGFGGRQRRGVAGGRHGHPVERVSHAGLGAAAGRALGLQRRPGAVSAAAGRVHGVAAHSPDRPEVEAGRPDRHGRKHRGARQAAGHRAGARADGGHPDERPSRRRGHALAALVPAARGPAGIEGRPGGRHRSRGHGVRARRVAGGGGGDHRSRRGAQGRRAGGPGGRPDHPPGARRPQGAGGGGGRGGARRALPVRRE
ncbi:MAG: Exopolyphosphatase, partial [uncultured Gemmatimonadetes bacterium]